jgi:predicted DNA-binding transcriptional regulator AlpA
MMGSYDHQEPSMQSANNVERSTRAPLLPDETRGKELLAFADLRLLGISYSRAHIYRLIKAGKFPRPVRLGDNRIAFAREKIAAYIEAIKAQAA